VRNGCDLGCPAVIGRTRGGCTKHALLHGDHQNPILSAYVTRSTVKRYCNKRVTRRAPTLLKKPFRIDASSPTASASDSWNRSEIRKGNN
jgi:hypothetical protein